MNWNISAEVISGIFVTIILIYAYRGTTISVLKNTVFNVCLLITFLSIVTNIVSSLLLSANAPIVFSYIVTFLNLLVTPFMGACYWTYVISILYENHPHVKKYIKYSIMAYGAYAVLLLTNFMHQSVFSINEFGYVRGPLINISYVIFYFYVLLCIIFSFAARKRTQKNIFYVIIIFPSIALVLIIIQQIVPQYILTGLAATAALLIVYLYLQNKRITVDSLTEMMNRQAFMNAVSSKTHQKQPFTIIVVSLRDFKYINDTFGQSNGDKFLQAISHELQLLFPQIAQFRYSGDEFALFLESHWVIQANDLVDVIAIRFRQPWEIMEYRCVINSAIGVVSYPDAAETLEEVINGIESTKRTCKRQEIHVSHYTTQMKQQDRRAFLIMQILKRNVDAYECTVYYQPIFSYEYQCFVGAEALMRLYDPTLGWISPEEFIPIAETSGLIVGLGYILFHKVCQEIQKLLSQNTSLKHVISINLSEVQLMQANFMSELLRIADTYQIPYSCINLEITERMINSNYELMKNFIVEMKKKGFPFSLDDFGVGSSNLATVIELPFDVIKIDKSLLWTSVHNEKCACLLENVIRAFAFTGFCVLCEGVEDAKQEQFAVNCGCTLIQGYFHAKPMIAEDMQIMLTGKTEAVIA